MNLHPFREWCQANFMQEGLILCVSIGSLTYYSGMSLNFFEGLTDQERVAFHHR